MGPKGRKNHQPRKHRAKVKLDEYSDSRRRKDGANMDNREPDKEEKVPKAVRELLRLQKAVAEPKPKRKRLQQKSAKLPGESYRQFEERMNKETTEILVKGTAAISRKAEKMREYRDVKKEEKRQIRADELAEEERAADAPTEGIEACVDAEGVPCFPKNDDIVGITSQADAPPDFRDLHNMSGEARLMRKHQDELKKRDEAREASTANEGEDRQSIVDQYRRKRGTKDAREALRKAVTSAE